MPAINKSTIGEIARNDNPPINIHDVELAWTETEIFIGHDNPDTLTAAKDWFVGCGYTMTLDGLNTAIFNRKS